jgi:MYXO-CTERM domain-containing protein
VAVGAGPALPSSDLPSASGSGSPSGISLTAVNDGRPASLLDAAHPVWGHADPATPTPVTVAAFVPDGQAHLWTITVDLPNAPGGGASVSCAGGGVEPRAQVGCVVSIPLALGLNLVEVTAVIDGRTVASADGIILGGALAAEALYEVLDATGHWTSLAADQAVTLPATEQTGLRYVVINTGTIPFRLVGGCDDRPLLEHQRVTCPVRGVRPAQSVAGRYRHHLEIRDVVGASRSFELRAALGTFSGAFSLSATTAVTGQQLIVRGVGLPSNGPFAVQYRLDEQAVPIGTSTTSAGAIRYGFVLRPASPGPAHLNIEHDGVTIASLPFEVTRTPVAPAPAPPPWAFSLLGLAALGAILLWRRRRGRARAAGPTS